MKITKSLQHDVQAKQLKWYEYDQRMGEKKIKRKGRLKTTWMDVIRRMMGEMGLTEDDWRDRENWRQKITGQVKLAEGSCENIV